MFLTSDICKYLWVQIVRKLSNERNKLHAGQNNWTINRITIILWHSIGLWCPCAPFPFHFSLLKFIISIPVAPKVKCTPDLMRVEIPISTSTRQVYLQGLKDYPDPACKPRPDPAGYLTILELNLNDVYQCATTRVTNKHTVRF